MLIKSLLPLAATLLWAIPASAQGNGSATIINNLLQIPELSILASQINNSALDDVRQKLNSTNALYTVFAPSDDALRTAFQSVNVNDTGLIKALINYHIARGLFLTQSLKPIQFVPTELTNETYAKLPNNSGQVVAVTKEDGSIEVNGVNVTRPNIVNSNGLIHVIEKVLVFPKTPSNTSAEETSTTDFARALNRTNLTSVVDGLTGVTIFAPKNGAFNGDNAKNDTTLANYLRFHIIQNSVIYSDSFPNGQNFTSIQGNNLTLSQRNGQPTVNGVKVIKTDILVSNGVLHVIDDILVPPNEGKNGTGNSTSGAAPVSGEHYSYFSTIALAVLVAFLAILL